MAHLTQQEIEAGKAAPPHLTQQEFEERAAAFIGKLNQNIDTNGFSFIGIMGDLETPAYGYTVGFWETWQHPEVFIVGLSIDVMHKLAWNFAKGVREGKSFRDGEEASEELLEGGFRFRFRKIEKPLRPLNMARRFYAGDDFEAVQAVYPDTEHLYPWDTGYRLDPRIQPLIVGDGSEGL